MDKTRLINTGIGIAGIAIQLLILEPWHEKISNDVKNLEARINETNQILKEERQDKKKEFKDL